MHEFVLGLFSFLRSFLHFLKIVFVFCIIMLLFYWVQNLTNSDWAWLGFIKPFLDGLLDVANKIYSIEFNVFGTIFELKYLSAVIILVLMILCMHLLIILSNVLEGCYRSAHFICKKTQEVVLNKSLKEDLEREERKLQKYTVTIHTQLKKKFAHEELNISIDEQNKIMNKFVSEKTGVKPMLFDGGYMYNFTNFDKIDTVLDILFKLINSNAPITCSICIQVGENMEQLKKLISLKHFGRISMAADTSYRYKFNETHRYQTSLIGVFQSGEGTIEAHEFKEIL